MTRQAKPSEFDKFKRYREGRKARGLKLVRIWLPDPHAPGFRKKARRQAALLRDAPEEAEALAFIAAASDGADWTA
jgi:Antitoxin MazE-like